MDRVELQRPDQPGRVSGQLGDRDRPFQAAAGADPAVVVDDHLEALPQLREERLPPVQVRAAHPHDRQQRRAFAAALVVELDLAHLRFGHERILPRVREREGELALTGTRRARARTQPPPIPPTGPRRPCPPTNPATRTPSSLTGRGGAYSSSSLNASEVTSSVSSVAAAERVGAGHGREVVEADLDRDRPSPPPVALKARAQLPGHPREGLLELLGSGDVLVEGPLPGLRGDLAGSTHDRVRFEPRPAAEFQPQSRPEARRQQALGRVGQRGQGGQPESGEPLGGLGADPRHQPGGRGGEALARLLRGSAPPSPPASRRRRRPSRRACWGRSRPSTSAAWTP